MSVAAGPSGKPARRVWSIGIYTGLSPFELAPIGSNPVLTAADVSETDASFVADPFMMRYKGVWHMYFEVLLRASNRGVIGMATSEDARSWCFKGIALEQPFHLSYPQVFEHSESIYMLPETLGAGAIRLYQATSFPNRFEPAGDLIEGAWADPTIFFYRGLWWLLACSTPYEHRTLHLFFAEQLLGPWQQHPRSPIVADDRHTARPGGRVLRIGRKMIRLAQDCVPRYGTRLLAIEMLELTRSQYDERICHNNPVLTPAGEGWNSVGMHHMDAHALSDGTWIACVDGFRFALDRLEPNA
jgi:hypothetical protein